VRQDVVLPAAELRWRFSRSSGPGGQGVNSTDSRVALVFDVAGSTALSGAQKRRLRQRLAARLGRGPLVVTASEHRSQWRNRLAARHRLASLLRQGLAPPPPARKATAPSRAARRRRLDDKRRRGSLKRLRRRPGPED
jgi:ribosome-associated protein